MALKHNNEKVVTESLREAPAPEQEAPRFEHVRNTAPHAGRSRNPIPAWLDRSNAVTVTPEIQEFVKEVTETVKTNFSSKFQNFEFVACTQPRSAYIAKATDENGVRHAYILCFIEMIGAEVPQNAPKSVALEIASTTLREEEPSTRIAGVRVITHTDLEKRRGQITRDMTDSLEASMQNFGSQFTIEDLSSGNGQFSIKTRDLNEVRRFFSERSPNDVLPPMNAGLVLSWSAAPQENRFGGRDEQYATKSPIAAVAVMIDFVASNQQTSRRYAEGPAYTPNIRITGIDTVYPLEGMWVLALLYAIDKFAYNDGWMDAFYTRENEMTAGDPGNLITSDDGSALVVPPEEADAFWRQYMNRFGDPIVTVDVEYGRRNNPIAFKLLSAANGSVNAYNSVINAVSRFFNDNGNFAQQISQSHISLGNLFSSEHVGIVSQKAGHHIDSRAITFLSAMKGIVAEDPNRDVAAALMNPDLVSADQKDTLLREWLGTSAFTPIWDTKTVVLHEDFVNALSRTLGQSRLYVVDDDEVSNRFLFKSRSSASEYGFRGTGLNLARGQSGTPGTRFASEWVSRSGDFMV